MMPWSMKNSQYKNHKLISKSPQKPDSGSELCSFFLKDTAAFK